MIRLTEKGRRELRLRMAQLTNLKAFEKAQRKSLFGIGNIVRREYREAWGSATYKRPAGRPSHRAAIKRSLRSVVRRLKAGVFRLRVGSSYKTNSLVRIVNILNPGFTPYRAKTQVPGKKIRERMMVRAKSIAAERYKDDLHQQLLNQASGKP